MSALCVSLCVALAWPQTVSPDDPTTADEVIAEYLRAIGGREKLDACRSMRATGTMAAPDGSEMRFVQEQERPNKYRFELRIPSGATVVQVFDGQKAWAATPPGGMVIELPPGPAGLIAEQADFTGPLVDHQRKGHRIELIGREQIAGRPTFKLKVTRTGAAKEDLEYHHLDAKSFLPIRVYSKRTAAGRTTEREIFFGDYKAVDGLLVAHEIRDREGPPGADVSIRKLERVELNVDLPDDRFSMEAARKAVAAKPSPVPVIKNEHAARALYDGMIAALRDAESLSFESEYDVAMGKMPLAQASYKAWLKKPNQFRMEANRRGRERGGILIGDGERLWMYWPNGRPQFTSEDPAEYHRTKSNVYLTKPTPSGRHSIGHEAGLLGAGIIMTIIDLSTFHGYTDSLQALIDAVAGRGTETVGEQQCDVIIVSIMEGQRTWKLWLSQRDHLPRKIEETVRVSVDLTAQERWTNVVVNGEIPDELFAWRPPTGWKEWHRPATEARLIKPGTPAPDFELKLADGTPTKLSDYRGKAVLLAFWRVG